MTTLSDQRAKLATLIAALESGNYAKAEGFLFLGPNPRDDKTSANYEWCCLGVQLTLEGWQPHDTMTHSMRHPVTRDIVHLYPPDELAEAYGLLELTLKDTATWIAELPDAYYTLDEHPEGFRALGALNDQTEEWTDAVLPALYLVDARLAKRQEVAAADDALNR